MSTMYRIGEESKKTVYEMFDRTEKTVNEDVRAVKTWMEGQPHLPEMMDDVKIKNFLNLNKFSIEKTKQKIDMYYTIRSVMPDFFVDANPKSERVQAAFNDMFFCTHTWAVDGIHRVYLFKFNKPDSFCPLEMSMIFFATFEVRLYEDFMVDDIIVLDFGNVTLSDMRKVTFTLVTKAAAVYQKVYSLRLKSLHFLNSPSYISMILPILKAVLKPKIFDRIQVHRDEKVLSEIFPPEHLPKDYGGDGPSLEELTNLTKQKLCEYQDRFDLLDSLKVDESLRPEKLNNDEILGFYGNFKKLDVD